MWDMMCMDWLTDWVCVNVYVECMSVCTNECAAIVAMCLFITVFAVLLLFVQEHTSWRIKFVTIEFPSATRLSSARTLCLHSNTIMHNPRNYPFTHLYLQSWTRVCAHAHKRTHIHTNKRYFLSDITHGHQINRIK